MSALGESFNKFRGGVGVVVVCLKIVSRSQGELDKSKGGHTNCI